MRTFTAQYAGKCSAECGHRIFPGDVVQYVEDQLVHEGCIPEASAERKPRPVCPECFTEIAMNGACSC